MKMISKNSPMRLVARAIFPLALLGALFVMSSCDKLIIKTPPPPLKSRIVVLDFKVPPEFAEKPEQIKGWWFGAHTVHQNPRAGAIFADTLSRALLPKPEGVLASDYLEQQSRTDVKYYLSDKRRLLMKQFKNLKEEEYDKILRDVSPVDYGMELGADQVITGRILTSLMTHQRTIGSWKSVFEAQIDIYDMASGKVVWSTNVSSTVPFSSQSVAMEKAAEKAARRIDSYYRSRK